jgi:hypothetical protein
MTYSPEEESAISNITDQCGIHDVTFLVSCPFPRNPSVLVEVTQIELQQEKGGGVRTIKVRTCVG